MLISGLPPHLRAFRTVGADVDFPAGAQHRRPEFVVGPAFPNFPEGSLPESPELMASIFVEAAGHHATVPGEYAAVPHFPTVVEQGIFDAVGAVGHFPVTGIFVDGRDQGVAVLVVVDLRGFEAHIVCAVFRPELDHLGDLMLIGLDHQKLEKYEGPRRFCPFFGFGQIFGSLEHLAQPAVNAVLFVDFLCGTVNADGHLAQAASHDVVCLFFADKMCVGRSGGVDASGIRSGEEVGDLWVDKRLTLKVELNVPQGRGDFVEECREQRCLEHARGSGEFFQSARAFGTAQVAGRGRLDRYGGRHAAVQVFAGKAGPVVARVERKLISRPSDCGLPEKIGGSDSVSCVHKLRS